MAMYGIDVSKWQNDDIVRNAGDFAIMKATEGCGYVDPTCDNKYQLAKSLGKQRGVYHFARPDLTDAVSEAKFFVENVKGYIHHAILILDWEVNQSNVAWAKKWLDTVYELTGVRPLIYMSAYYVNAYDWSSVAKNYGLWIAGYPSKYYVPNPPKPREDELPYSIGAWAFCCIWQYSDSAGSLDRDIAYLTVEQWRKYAGANDAKTETKKEETKKEEPKQEQPKQEEQPKVEPIEKPTDEPIFEPIEPIEPNAKPFNAEDYSELIRKARATNDLIEETAHKYGVKLVMPSKLYDFLKMLAVAILPAISMLYLGLANIWGFGFGEQVDETIQLLIAVINTIVGLTVVKASKDYKDGEK